ncbi:tRNA (guanine-N(7)-)-methyltransferase non-catalytic subunit WDR4 [Fopius arisanus]|uniref:tRNA (Guanine-N(7)-)-methyltransferase non-catalytic subunit WDR4 n=1 Tax=Fopius arisanus TaxID=64838 RepID=A0A9R1SZ90_9HYME|nr:PREDICTED: tRNA (guanine-N(7)-)-methyltransferase non-catalytic subunit WDR4 [Fopius arisanus]
MAHLFYYIGKPIVKSPNLQTTMSFSVFDSTLILCTSSTILKFSLPQKSLEKLILPEPLEKQTIPHNNSMDSFQGITSVSFSTRGDYFGICTNKKQLCLYRTKDLSLLSNRTLVRAASRVKFTPKDDVIVADKSGDAYVFSTSNPGNSGDLILGHLSMLLDIVVSQDERFIITADRDEKIRISNFPNSYSIQSFCLGHTTFVSNILELPHDRRVLVSAGGDGTFRFWNYVDGTELKSVNFMEKVQEGLVERLNEDLKDLELQEAVRNLPVKRLALQEIRDSPRESIMVSSFYGSGLLLVYQVHEDLDVEFLQTIVEDEEPLEMILSGGKLWILLDWGVKAYRLEGTFLPDSEVNNALGKLNDRWKELRASASKQIYFPILYKRKFDNVQEYQERKKSRLKVSA